MSSVLAEFLKDKARVWRASEAERAQSLADWKQAIETLLTRIREWVTLADTEGVVAIRMSDVERVEERFGRYTVPVLTIDFGPRWVHVIPVARFAIGVVPGPDGGDRSAAGCVALSDHETPDAAYPSYRLYRLADPAGDRWFISAGGPPDREFTREVFERILVGLWK